MCCLSCLLQQEANRFFAWRLPQNLKMAETLCGRFMLTNILLEIAGNDIA